MSRTASFITWGLLAAAFLLTQGCITDITAMRTEINDLKQDSYQTKRDLAEIKKNQLSLRQNVGTLKDRPAGVSGEDSLAALRASQTDLYSQVQDTVKEVQDISGRFDERNYAIDKQLRNLTAEVDLLKSKVETGGGSSGAGEAPPDVRDRLSRVEADIVFLKAKLSAIEAQGGAAAPAPAASADDAYSRAYQLFKESKYTDARVAMEEFLDRFPNNSLAGNAQFWIGECYYQEQQYENAILAYDEVIKKYRTNRKVPAAMLKQGFAFANIGDKDAARSILRGVMDKYPGSDLAQAAKKKLATLR
jgi:tol-pal system protein YbgF